MKNKSKVKTLTLQDRSDTSFYQFNPVFGFWGKPDIERDVSFEQRRDEVIRVSHNAEGNRDSPFDRSCGKKTILCVGGSHTWGGGVEQHLRYTDRLSERSGLDVINLGHCSLGFDQVCLTLLEKSSFYSPNIVIVEQYPWAIHRVLNTFVNGYVKPHFFLDSQQKLKLQKVPWLARFKIFRAMIGAFHSYRKEFREFQAGINLKEGYDPACDPIFLYWKSSYYDYLYKLVDSILGVMRDFCLQRGIKLLFALGVVGQRLGPQSGSALVDYDLPRNRLIHLLEKNQIRFVDMTNKMLLEHSEKAPVIFFDGHINAKGHDIFSQVLFDKLNDLGWLTT